MTGGWEVLAAAGAIGLVLARIAWRDGTRFEVAWGDVLLLAALGAWWQGGVAAWVSILAGVVLGAGAIVGQMVVARSCGRRSPVCAGDALMMAAAGAVLGPMGLALSWLANVPAGLAYRWWLGRRRGRPWHRGYVPMAPAYCTAAATVLVWQAATGRGGL